MKFVGSPAAGGAAAPFAPSYRLQNEGTGVARCISKGGYGLGPVLHAYSV